MIGKASIIAPDSSHWSLWLDAMRSPKPDVRQRAESLHLRLMDQGRVPLLSWHHLEELLGGKDDACAADRVASLQAMPFMAWLRLPPAQKGLGSIVDIFAAEVMAVCEGHSDLAAVRDHARQLLLMTGNGRQAIGEHGWVWEAIRPDIHSRQDHVTAVASLGSMQMFDKTQTVGALSKMYIANPATIRAKLSGIHQQAFQRALRGTDGDEVKARAIADAFIERTIAMGPASGSTVRDLLVSTLTGQGVDEAEIRDECVVGDLIRLGYFRSLLRVAAEVTGRSFASLKHVSMNLIPSFAIEEAIQAHRQPREKLPGSDLHDRHLAVLAAYCDVLYVDRRMSEDLLRVRRKEPGIDALMGDVRKASDFEMLLEKP
ncbi:hypothetical protein [Novacetimonas pomaceti]|uniref:hypothetical protein n=1 Tax=Novacetimonas pomaceti TaxID=2021998 RepID=UPI001EF0D762|nr:hypothetical protein [Novacetimonas pomaceti]